MIIADILNIVTIFQLILLSFFLLFGKNKLSNRFLAVFFIIQSFTIFDVMIWRYFDWSVGHIAHVFFIPHMISKLWGVSLMFFILSTISSSFKLRKYDLLHLIPMISYGVYMIIIYFQYPLSIKTEKLITNTVYSRNELIILVSLTQLVNVCYLIYIIIRLKKYSDGLQDYYSSSKYINIRWLNFIVYGFSFLWLIALLQYSMYLVSGNGYDLMNLTNPIIFVLACYICIRGWMKPEIFEYTMQKEKYHKYQLTDTQKAAYLKSLESIMHTRKPYLDSELTLSVLSELTAIPERHLSQIINESIGCNFYDYVNGFRVRESIDYLISKTKNKNMLEILLDVGFNSKTAFNVAFKKITGMSPSEYKKINSTQSI
jgi:AraC-like DNA-binding protein